MTREDAIEIITNTMFIGSSADDIDTAINMAIQALEQIGKIKTIIDSGVYIQEDVLRYKMICEVVEE